VRTILVGCLAALVFACKSEDSENPVDLPAGDSSSVHRDAGRGDAATAPATGDDASAPREGGFVTRVVSFTPGACAGYGQEQMPDVVLGPPKGGGNSKGSTDVVSLGNGGEIVLSFEPNMIVDGDGDDFIVFENAFYASGDSTKPYAELAEVSVSDDGTTWTAFPCTAKEPPYGACAGWHPVLASEGAAFEPSTAGGDSYDLASIGVKRARFVRIQDKTAQRCTSQGPNTNGFDLDAAYATHTASQ